MSKTEAYCTHCGSLINVDDSKEKSKCIFCGEEMETAKALALNTNSEARLLLQNAASEKSKEESSVRKEQEKLSMKEMAAKAKANAAKGPKQEIVLRPLPMKTKLIILVSFLGIVAIIAAVFVPLIMTRNANRAAIEDRLSNSLGYEITSQAFKYNDNREFILSVKDTVEEAGAIEIFEKYASVYSEVTGKDAGSVKQAVTVIVFDAEGRYICQYKDGSISAVFETGTPTHTPTPEPTAEPTQAVSE